MTVKLTVDPEPLYVLSDILYSGPARYIHAVNYTGDQSYKRLSDYNQT